MCIRINQMAYLNRFFSLLLCKSTNDKRWQKMKKFNNKIIPLVFSLFFYHFMHETLLVRTKINEEEKWTENVIFNFAPKEKEVFSVRVSLFLMRLPIEQKTFWEFKRCQHPATYTYAINAGAIRMKRIAAAAAFQVLSELNGKKIHV